MFVNIYFLTKLYNQSAKDPHNYSKSNIISGKMANRVLEIFASVAQNIDDDLQGFTPLKKICDQYKLKPSYIFVPVVVLVILCTFIGLCEHIFVTLFGLLYPAYMSFKVRCSLLRP